MTAVNRFVGIVNVAPLYQFEATNADRGIGKPLDRVDLLIVFHPAFVLSVFDPLRYLELCAQINQRFLSIGILKRSSDTLIVPGKMLKRPIADGDAFEKAAHRSCQSIPDILFQHGFDR